MHSCGFWWSFASTTPARLVQLGSLLGTGWTTAPLASTIPPVRVLTHIKKLDDSFGDFRVRVICECGSCREIEPKALARLVGWKMTLSELALRMRCSQCGKKAAEVVAVARP